MPSRCLTTQMKSVGEVMAIGRTFRESLQKAMRGLEVWLFRVGVRQKGPWGKARKPTLHEIKEKLARSPIQIDCGGSDMPFSRGLALTRSIR